MRWLGRQDYQAVWDLQRDLAARRLAGTVPDTLLLLEHPPTITLGRRARPAHLLVDPEALRRQGVCVIASDRGGDVTYHGPGQLVGYPIFHLGEPPHTPDLRRYVRCLEEVLIRALGAFEVSAGRFGKHTGVWVGCDTTHPEKIAAIGVRVSRWVTLHGFALNVQPDLSHFRWIVPCGIADYGVTSLSRVLGRAVAVAEVIPAVVRGFVEVFGVEARGVWPDGGGNDGTASGGADVHGARVHADRPGSGAEPAQDPGDRV
ncbi:MAG: lipoyl(octanoyl) transferase LipB [Chloroherpetonaceae bacterium]|nr:lipoyl(octanoyl) transferase LipB [Chloroherpetonaceae bacterium]